MLLYHGSNVAVEKPKIIRSNRALDFGSGFYLTSDYEQAEKWAKLTVLRRGVGEPTVTVYETNDYFCKLKILKFNSANIEWLNFIVANRTNKNVDCSDDIIVGPVANDNTMPVINLYLSGAYDENEALKRLLTQKLKDQYTFKTEESIKALCLCEVITL